MAGVLSLISWFVLITLSKAKQSQNHDFQRNISGNFVMGGIVLGKFELPVSNNQEEDQLQLYDSTEGKEWDLDLDVEKLHLQVLRCR